MDFSVVKDTAIHERLRAQFRAEAFNVLNHVNLGVPSAGFVPAADGWNRNDQLGVINSSRDARIMQLGLKLIF